MAEDGVSHDPMVVMKILLSHNLLFFATNDDCEMEKYLNHLKPEAPIIHYLLPMMSDGLVLDQHMGAAWRNFDLVITILENFNAAFIVCFIFLVMTKAMAGSYQRQAPIKFILMFGFACLY
jgi:hypothetical protein